MAQLKSTNIIGNLSVTGNILTELVKTNQLQIDDSVKANKIVLTNTDNASQTSLSNPAIRVGDSDSTIHLLIDRDAIMAKGTSTTVGTLYLNESGGLVKIGSGGLETSGSIIISTTGKGHYLKDSSGYSYPGVYDNGANLWLGATATAAKHHKGSTYISSGYNGTSGNRSIFVSVPNNTNDNANNYEVFHTNNFGNWAVKLDGSNVTAGKTWGINISGKAATATNATNATNAANATLAASAAKWTTARNFSIRDYNNAYDASSAVSVDGSAAVTLKLPEKAKFKTINTNLISGRAYPAGKSKYYHKIASFTQSIASSQVNTALTLLVSGFYGTSNTINGLLKAMVRYEQGGTAPGFAYLRWIAADADVTPSNFILTHKVVSNTVTLNIYAYMPSTWTSLNFTKLSEHNWGDSDNQFGWTFLSAIDGSTNMISAIPSDETQVPSTAGSLINNAATATALTTSAGSTTVPIYFTNGKPASVSSVGVGNGGTGNTSFTANTLIYASSATKLSSLAAATVSGSELTMTGSSTTRTSFKAKNGNGAVSLLASTNRGLYDETTGGWIVQMLQAGTAVYIPKWANKGNANAPVYFDANGQPAICTYVSVAKGGTGNTTMTANRLVWTENANKMTAGYHYADSTHVGIGRTSAAPAYALYVGTENSADGRLGVAKTITLADKVTLEYVTSTESLDFKFA